MTLSERHQRPINELLVDESELLLRTPMPVSRERLHRPTPDVVSRLFETSDRSPQVLRRLQQLFGAGRLAQSGYPSILPMDQGIEQSAAHSFAPNPDNFDSEDIVEQAWNMARKAFKKRRQEGAALIQMAQDVCLDPTIAIA